MAQTNQNRDISNRNAQRTAGWYSDDAYMSEVGKEGTKRQQDGMRVAADAEDARIQRRRPVRDVKRTPAKSARRK